MLFEGNIHFSLIWTRGVTKDNVDNNYQGFGQKDTTKLWR